MSNKQIVKDGIMERARVHGMMGRRAGVHGKDLRGRRARVHGKAISHNVPYACRIFFCRLVPPLLVINQSDRYPTYFCEPEKTCTTKLNNKHGIESAR